MMELMLDAQIKAKCAQAILITGMDRSGTTVVGNLLHSMEGVEYVLHPPLLTSLVPLIDQMDRKQFELLYETYLYEEFLFNALAGRAVNCNLEDDSSIYKVKDNELVRRRLTRSLRKRDADQEIEAATIAYKLTNITPVIPILQEYYPQTRVVLTTRNANDVLHSTIERQWFSDEMLRTQNLVWPNYFLDGMRIPFFVSPEDVDFWMRSDELHRSAYCYVQGYMGTDKIANLTTVNYDELILEPERVVSDLAKSLGLSLGPKTPELVSLVKKTEKDRDQGYVDRLTEPLKEQVLRISELSAVT